MVVQRMGAGHRRGYWITNRLNMSMGYIKTYLVGRGLLFYRYNS